MSVMVEPIQTLFIEGDDRYWPARLGLTHYRHVLRLPLPPPGPAASPCACPLRPTVTLVEGIAEAPDVGKEFARHDESLAACQYLPGFFSYVGHVGVTLIGYAIWRVVGAELQAWPSRIWGGCRCRRSRQEVASRAFAEGERRGATIYNDSTWLPPAVVRRWLGYPLEHVGNLWRLPHG